MRYIIVNIKISTSIQFILSPRSSKKLIYSSNMTCTEYNAINIGITLNSKRIKFYI